MSNTMQFSVRNLGSALIAVSTLLVLPVRAGLAQSSADTMPPVMLIHGFTSDSTTWDETVNYLRQVAGFSRVHRTNTAFLQGLDGQAGFLNTYAANNGLNSQSPILAAHSMGGLLARRLSWNFPVDAIITIGTPHQGHPLISSAQNRAVILTMGGLLAGLGYDIYNGLSRCHETRYDMNGNPRDGPCYDVFGMVITTLSAATLVYLVEEDLLNGGSMSDMDPSGPWIAALNSESGRAQELTSRKVSLVGRLMPWEEGVSFYRNLFAEYWAPSVAYSVDFAGYLLTFLSVDMFADLQWDDPWFYEKSLGALHTAAAGVLLSGLPLWWNSMLGGWPNDGFIPIGQQIYPGAVLIDAYGLAHGEETSSQDIKSKVQETGSALVRH